MQSKILFIDTETGGLNEWENSLLTLGMVVWENGEILAEQEIKIKQPIYKVTAKALEVNGIDILQHDREAVDAPTVFTQIHDFILHNMQEKGSNWKSVRLGGHNTAFDVRFVKRFFQDNKRDYQNFFSHRAVDTCVLLRSLFDAGIIGDDVSASDKAFPYFGIEVDGRHTALGDARATAELYTVLLTLMGK